MATDPMIVRSKVGDFIRRNPTIVVGGALLILITLAALLAPLITPQDPYNQATLDLAAARLMPIWCPAHRPAAAAAAARQMCIGVSIYPSSRPRFTRIFYRTR